MGGDQVAVPGVRGLRGALLRLEVDVDEAEALVVALGPSNTLPSWPGPQIDPGRPASRLSGTRVVRRSAASPTPAPTPAATSSSLPPPLPERCRPACGSRRLHCRTS